MFDILPRFELVQRSGLIPDYYLINTTAQFQKDSLQVLNIPSHQILSPTHSTHIEADELIVPSLPGPVFNVTPQPRACRYLRSTFLQSARARTPHRALYITRADASDRRVINEAEIREEVIANGFEIVSLSNVPFLQQVEIFSDAKIIVGPHGAGFTNAVFCQPGSALIEFLPQWRKIDCFERLARFVGMEYRSIEGVRRGDSSAQVSESDYTVDRAALRGLLRQFT
jgi:capsular polysaccharide biosynthesis protein